MATLRIVGSSYGRSNTNYVTVTDDSNMYNNTDHTSNYTTLRGRAGRNSNSTYYAFINGFDFTSLPTEATVSSFKVKIRAYRGSYMATGSSYRIRLASQASNSYAISNTTLSEDITTTSGGTVYEIPTGSLTWSQLEDYGTNFSIEIPLRNSSTSSSNYPYVYVYGAEVEVTYTMPVQYSVTIQNNSSATVMASDTAPYEGDDVVILTNTLSGLTITDNGTNITSQFTQASGDAISAVPGSHFTTGFSSTSGNFYQNSSTTSTSWLEYAIGHSAESPYSTSNTSNTYVKPEGSTGWINYEFDFSSIPTSATISSVSVKVYGARENSAVDSTHVARFQCYSGSTAKGTLQNFTSTSNGSVTVTDVGTWTAAELHDAILRFEVGYYGGRMLGITWTVVYELSGYVYTISNIATNHTIVVSSGGVTTTMYIKVNGSWVAATKVYKKVNGSWVEQSDLTNVFTEGVNYVKR